MASLGTALAVIAFADQCLKYGDKFIRRCRSYLHADEESTELLVAIENNWVKVETQIEILKKVAPGLNKKLQDMQAQVLSQLEGKLKTASLVIDQLMTQKNDEKGEWKHDDRDLMAKMKDIGALGRMKRAKYVMKKKALLQVLDDIEKWQARYDPSWILIMQMSVGNIDEQLDKHHDKKDVEQIPIIKAAKGIRDVARASQDSNVKDRKTIFIPAQQLDLKPSSIPNSSVHISKLDDEKNMVLIDTMICNPAANMKSTIKEVSNLARILAEVDPTTFGLLKCRGVIKVPKTDSEVPLTDFKFIFDIPYPLMKPQSLRGIFLSQTLYPLDERLELAKKLTSSVLFVHTVNFVHKNIRPETVIVFQNERSDIGAPYLAGFEQFRLEDSMTYKVGDDLWDHNLYRHPSRQGTNPEVQYQMQHDIYSLGVVLLEIGLWTSFVVNDAEDESSPPVPNAILGPVNLEQLQVPLGTAEDVKERLESLAERELPARLGKRYTEIVLLCLRCLDSTDGTNEKDNGFGVGATEWTNEDGVVIGVRFIENVLEKMQGINM